MRDSESEVHVPEAFLADWRADQKSTCNAEETWVLGATVNAFPGGVTVIPRAETPPERGARIQEIRQVLEDHCLRVHWESCHVNDSVSCRNRRRESVVTPE